MIEKAQHSQRSPALPEFRGNYFSTGEKQLPWKKRARESRGSSVFFACLVPPCVLSSECPRSDTP